MQESLQTAHNALKPWWEQELYLSLILNFMANNRQSLTLFLWNEFSIHNYPLEWWDSSVREI